MKTNVEIEAIIKRVKMQLAAFYNGDAWVTENFKEKVLSIEPDVALKKIPGHSHSVAELVGHMTAWRNFAIQKLTGNNNYDIKDNSETDWPELNDWETTCKEFELYHQNFLSAIESFPLDSWNETVPGRNYSFIYLLNGIIEHDYYHYGQIGSLIAGIKKM
ncbi:MAG: DinB family protein [Ginsengibacter sp.]